MAKVTRITLHFDDGTSYEVDPATGGSIFVNEGKAQKCGHRPPWKKPPQDEETSTMATTEETGGGCFIVNGVIVCP
jgi:hypothetical protein